MPVFAQAQSAGRSSLYQSYIPPGVVVTPPPFTGGEASAGNPLPFETQQMQQQRLLEMLGRLCKRRTFRICDPI